MVFAKEKRAKSLCVATEWLVRFRRPTPSFRSCASQSPWVFPHWSQDCFPGSTLPQSSTFRCNHQEQNCMYPQSICNSLDPATSIRSSIWNHTALLGFKMKSYGCVQNLFSCRPNLNFGWECFRRWEILKSKDVSGIGNPKRTRITLL